MSADQNRVEERKTTGSNRRNSVRKSGYRLLSQGKSSTEPGRNRVPAESGSGDDEEA